MYKTAKHTCFDLCSLFLLFSHKVSESTAVHCQTTRQTKKAHRLLQRKKPVRDVFIIIISILLYAYTDPPAKESHTAGACAVWQKHPSPPLCKGRGSLPAISAVRQRCPPDISTPKVDHYRHFFYVISWLRRSARMPTLRISRAFQVNRSC